MGSIVNGITGLFGGGTNPNNNASSISGLSNVASQQQQLASNLNTQGSDIYGPAFGQYNSGISGQLTPAQSALVGQNLSTMDTATAGTYGNLGIGGSTMENQDLTGNSMRSLAEQSNINFQNEQLGLSGLQEALGYFGGAGQLLGGASTSIGNAGSLQTANQGQLNDALNTLSSKISGLAGSAGGSAATSGTTGAIGGNTAADLGGGAAAGALGGAAAADLGAGAAAGGTSAAGLAGVGDLVTLLLAA